MSIDISYEESLQLLDSSYIRQNDELLNSTFMNIQVSSLLSREPDIGGLNNLPEEIFYIEPEFLRNPCDSRKSFLKKEILDKKTQYENLIKQVNKLINNKREKIKDFHFNLDNLEKKIQETIIFFKNNTINLCTPLVSKKKGLESIDISYLSEEKKAEFEGDRQSVEKMIEGFKEEAEILNKNYNYSFSNIREAVEVICNRLNNIFTVFHQVQNTIDNGRNEFETYLETIEDNENFNLFENIKKLFENVITSKENTEKQLEKTLSILNRQYFEKKKGFLENKSKYENLLNNLKHKSKDINDKIEEIRKNYNQEKIDLPSISLSNMIYIINKKVIEALDKCNEESEYEEKSLQKGVEEIKINCDIIRSLDILIMLDITGSMDYYFDDAKKNIIHIIDKVRENCYGINVNLGLIAYKDKKEHENDDYINENFTQDYNSIKKRMEEIKVGGGDDAAEDIALAFELANKKNWGSQVKFAILVADAPCHGKKYHDDIIDDYPDGIPERKDIEESVKELAEKDVNLFCLEINQTTKKMYKIFGDIYKNCSKKYIEFHIVETKKGQENPVSNIVIQKSTETFFAQNLNI